MESSDLFQKIVRTLEDLSIPYLITGSVAAMAYGEPRFTNDIDVVADLQVTHLTKLRAALPEDEYYFDERAALTAIRRRGQFNIIQPAAGLKVDIILPRWTPFDASRFGRIRRVQAAEQLEASFASPEDVIVKKLEYFQQGGSDKHLRDIASILKVSGGQIDRGYISQWADRLGLRDVWDAILGRLDEVSG